MKSNFEIQKRKIQLAEKKLYNLNGYFKEPGLISSVKKAISEPIQFNLRAVKQGNGNYGFSIDSIFQSDNNFTPIGQQTTIKTIGQMLSESSDSVLTLWKPLINNRITGLESYAIQLAVVAEFLDNVVKGDFANEMDLLTVPNLSNKIYSTFKTFLTR